MLKTLEEIRKWVRFSGWRNVKDVLIETLKEPEEIVAYSMTDGNASIRDIIAKTSMSFRAVRGCWSSWTNVGIVETIEVGRGTRAKALFDLEDFGIQIPELKPEVISAVEEEEEEKNEQ